MKVNSIDKNQYFGKTFGTKNPLDYKAPKNAKYENIKATVYTGKTMNDVDLKSDKYISKRKDQNFNRIEWNFVRELMDKENNTQTIYGLMQEQPDNKSVVSQNSKLSQIKENQIGVNLINSEFLLVDVREEEKYNIFKIKEAVHYPLAQIRQGKYIKSIYDFKNKEKKIIIVYGLDEKEGIQGANQLFEKGYDNIYLLTGGIEKVAIKCPELVCGQIPAQIEKNRKLFETEKIFVKRSKLGDTQLDKPLKPVSVIKPKEKIVSKK